MYTRYDMMVKKAKVAGLLERICQDFELTDTQHNTAEVRYGAIGRWLAGSDDPLLQGATIYPQGSTVLQTTVKPIGRNEHDVDLVCHLPHLSADMPPELVKRIVGDRLSEHGYYATILQPMSRCWRLDYANEFHLDITPSIPNLTCSQNGEWVPDRIAQAWKASNPKGYRQWFEERASLEPRFLLQKSIMLDEKRAHVEPYPERSQLKGILRRVVQLAKAHRDRYFETRDPSLAPISVIITTLAAHSYKECVTSGTYDDELDLLADVIRRMPDFIEAQFIDNRPKWVIPNATTMGENFAEKWNSDPRRASAFYEWHQSAYAQLSHLHEIEGRDVLTEHLGKSFGAERVKRLLNSETEDLSAARMTGHISFAPGVGVTIGASSGKILPPNTFYGDE